MKKENIKEFVDTQLIKESSSLSEMIDVMKKERSKNRFVFNECLRRIEDKYGNDYNLDDMPHFINVVNNLYHEALLYPLFVKWLMYARSIAGGVYASDFENEITYENKYIQKIDNILKDYDLSKQVYEVLKRDLGEKE